MSTQDDIIVVYEREEIDVAGHEVEQIAHMIEAAPDLGWNRYVVRSAFTLDVVQEALDAPEKDAVTYVVVNAPDFANGATAGQWRYLTEDGGWVDRPGDDVARFDDIEDAREACDEVQQGHVVDAKTWGFVEDRVYRHVTEPAGLDRGLSL